MTQPKRGLGRGLDALLGGAAAPTAEPEAEAAREEPAPPPQRETPPPAPIARRDPEPEPYERRPVAIQPARGPISELESKTVLYSPTWSDFATTRRSATE